MTSKQIAEIKAINKVIDIIHMQIDETSDKIRTQQQGGDPVRVEELEEERRAYYRISHDLANKVDELYYLFKD